LGNSQPSDIARNATGGPFGLVGGVHTLRRRCHMYIGLGTLVVILIIVLIIYFVRRA
jgi:hypothetical protein